MKFLLLLVFILGMAPSLEAYSRDCNAHPIYCRIITLNPWIDKDFAFRLSNIIHKEASNYGIDPMISVAILMQESAFRKTHSYRTEVTSERYCDERGCYVKAIEKKTVADLGIAQINVSTALYYKINIERLFDHDLEYAIKAHFRILSDKIRACRHLGDEAWTCYHSANEGPRLIYLRDVSRHLK